MSRRAVIYIRAVSLAAACSAAVQGTEALAEKLSRDGTGQEIYQAMCANCHGDAGEGVADKHDEPLNGNKQLPELIRVIDRTMPEDDPDKLDAEGARKVAEYIYGAFYSAEARAKASPPRVELARLTVQQQQNALADLIGSFRDMPRGISAERGLDADYYDARDFNGDKKSFERRDPQIRFAFGEGAPSEGTNQLGTEAFAIRWRGSLLVEETGDYEFRLRTENGARLYLNDNRKALIDEWVSSGPEVRESAASIRLLGGRAYPLGVDFFTFKEKTASIVLEWKPPHKAWEAVPEQHLTPQRVPETFVLATAFPPDDGSAGYERGTTVSREWDQAATFAAVEAAGYVIDHLQALAGVKEDTADRGEKLKAFCETFAARAFRRELTSEQKSTIRSQFDGAADLKSQDAAVKRVVLLALKSPHFLYTEIPDGTVDAHDVAARLAFALWDSPPDKELIEAAARDELKTAAQVQAQSTRMLKDSRARTKMRGFFQHWLNLEEAEDLSKDPETYPEFTAEAQGDLRTSLELFIDEVVWSEASDYRQLLLADYVFLNSRLKKIYAGQIAGEAAGSADSDTALESGSFEKVKFAGGERTGVLTHPYLLSAFAYHKSSSPIHRGVFLTRNIVGRFLKPPPMAIQFMDGRFDPNMTMREKVTELTSPNNCMGCHSVINPLGFSLENFDGIGRFRTMEHGKPVDASSDYMTTGGDVLRLNGARDVAEHAARSKEAHQGFVRQLFQHMVKQPAQAYGKNKLRELREIFEKQDYNIQKMMVEIATTAALHGTGGNNQLAKGD